MMPVSPTDFAQCVVSAPVKGQRTEWSEKWLSQNNFIKQKIYRELKAQSQPSVTSYCQQRVQYF